MSAALGGRARGTWSRDGRVLPLLLEWLPKPPEDVGTRVAEINQRIPTGNNAKDEIGTFNIEVVHVGTQTAIGYEYPGPLVNLREVLLSMEEPCVKIKLQLGLVIATQIRSLHVRFRFLHSALRLESFVFQGDPEKPDLTNPRVLDWLRSPGPEIYQHPQYQADEPFWFYDAWSLMMALSEVVEWRPVDGTFRDEEELLEMKLARKERVMSSHWNCTRTAKAFQQRFKFLDQDRHTLKQMNQRDIEDFFDRLCELFESPVDT